MALEEWPALSSIFKNIKAGQGEAGRGAAGPGKARARDSSDQGSPWSVGSPTKGRARLGTARQGKARAPIGAMTIKIEERAMQSVTLKLIGQSALLLHSDRGANPLAAETVAHKALTSKRK